MFTARFFIVLFITLISGKLIAQPVDIKNYEFNLGFYVGQPSYWGDYNGGLFGTSYSYRGGETPTAAMDGDVSYGLSAWLPIKWGFSYRQGVEFGTLVYGIPDVDYFMNTPYTIHSFSIQYDIPFSESINPYLVLGYDYLIFKTPVPNFDPEFSNYSTIVAYQSGKSSTIPFTIGINYQLGRLSTLFAETSMRITATDALDNFKPTDSKFSFGNDVIFSYQIGLRVKVIDVVKLMFKPSKPEKVRNLAPVQPYLAVNLGMPDLMTIPDASLNTNPEKKQPDVYEVPDNAKEVRIPDVTPPTPAVTPPIPMVDLNNRSFDPKEELKKLEELKKNKAQVKETNPNPEPEPAVNPKSTLDWDPTVPILQQNISEIPEEILDNGLALDTPPEGYYVQVFATVGPITAARVRQNTIDILKRARILENPEKQVIIMKRRKFYEIRIGVFDNYQNTIQVLRTMQGTYFDSYTLIYLPDNQ